MKFVGLILALLVIGLVAPSMYMYKSSSGVVEEAIPRLEIVNINLVFTTKVVGNMYLLGEDKYLNGSIVTYNPSTEPVEIVNISMIYPVDFGGKCKVLVEPLERFKANIVKAGENASISVDTAISIPCSNVFKVVVSYCGMYSGICGHVSRVVEVVSG